MSIIENHCILCVVPCVNHAKSVPETRNLRFARPHPGMFRDVGVDPAAGEPLNFEQFREVAC